MIAGPPFATRYGARYGACECPPPATVAGSRNGEQRAPSEPTPPHLNTPGNQMLSFWPGFPQKSTWLWLCFCELRSRNPRPLIVQISASITCPFCGQTFELVIDTSIASQADQLKFSSRPSRAKSCRWKSRAVDGANRALGGAVAAGARISLCSLPPFAAKVRRNVTV